LIGSTREQLVLAIETTAPLPGAALARASGLDVRIVAEEYAAESARAENLEQHVRAAIEHAGARPADVTALAVVDGPGSYTALRVGLALARGFAAANVLPIAVCGSLELIAETCASAARVCALLDASHGKVYAAGFERRDGELRELHAAVVLEARDLPSELERWGGKWTSCGDARLAEHLQLDAVAPAHRAALLARLGAKRVLEGKSRSAEEVLPRYVGATGARLPRTAEPPAGEVSI
jgi:tRNA threonylcarbamoyladenosine biosynthesis protein TsaB